MYIDEEIREKEKANRKRRQKIIVFLVAMALFFVDGTSLLKMAIAKFGIISNQKAQEMVLDVEYQYLYKDVFQSNEYKIIREKFLDKPIKTYGDFKMYAKEMAKLAGDKHTGFVYNSISEMCFDYTLMNMQEEIDGFKSFKQDNIPVIQLKQFIPETSEKVCDALKDLSNKGQQEIVIDLTDNPGGVLKSCVDICDALLPETLIIEEEYNDHSRYQHFSDSKQIKFDHIYILLTPDSASCSEIMALVLKEKLGDKVTLIGNETYGKNVIQSVDQNDELGYALFLVTAKWSVNGKNADDLKDMMTFEAGDRLNTFNECFDKAQKLIKLGGK